MGGGKNCAPSSGLLYFTLLYFTLLYSTILYATLLYSTLLYSTLLYYLTHLPYRNWCPICVKARGREDPHRRKSSKKREETEEDAIPELALHYNELDADDGEKLKTIVGKDKPSGRVLQHKIGKNR